MSCLIVTHCYAEKLPQYARFLDFQLASLVRHATTMSIAVNVYTTKSDHRTVEVASKYENAFIQAGMLLRICLQEPGALFRRSIGRNHAALNSHEDLVWFTDVDHYFGDDCLEELWRVWTSYPHPKPALLFPDEIRIHTSHAIGDQLALTSGTPELDTTQFVIKNYNRAIGGVQIANGTVCRRAGYLDSHKRWQTPRSDGQPFRDFRDDVAFRNLMRLEGRVERIKLPNLYRLRHSLTTY